MQMLEYHMNIAINISPLCKWPHFMVAPLTWEACIQQMVNEGFQRSWLFASTQDNSEGSSLLEWMGIS